MGNCNRKIIFSNHVVEVYDYEKIVSNNLSGSGGRPKDLDRQGKASSEEVRRSTLRKSRNELRRLITANFNEHSKFVTLTFNGDAVPDYKDVRACNEWFRKYIMRMRYKYGDFKYAVVIEFQDKNGRGAVHYHMISDLPYIPSKSLAETWRGGFIKINDIGHVDNIGAYMIKYMVKDMDDSRLQGRKSYLTSKNLDRPIVARGLVADKTFELLELEKKETVFTNCYTSEYCGQVTYREYNLKRQK